MDNPFMDFLSLFLVLYSSLCVKYWLIILIIVMIWATSLALNFQKTFHAAINFKKGKTSTDKGQGKRKRYVCSKGHHSY